MEDNVKMRSTTILCVKRGSEVVIASDGQVTLGNMVEKGNACKLRKFKNGKILVGFAGSVADCMTLLDRLEKKVEQYDELERSCYELAKEWRTDKYIRNLESSIIVTDGKQILSLSGDGNVLEPENKNIASVGSGSVFAISSARALYDNTKMSAEEIVRESMRIAGDMCIYTNHNLSLEKIIIDEEEKEEKKATKMGKKEKNKEDEESEKQKANKKASKLKEKKVEKEDVENKTKGAKRKGGALKNAKKTNKKK